MLKKIMSQASYYTTIVSKLALPKKFLRYYPPLFVLRDPRIESVKETFRRDKQAVVIVFNVNNMKDFRERFGCDYVNQIKVKLKKSFKHAIKMKVDDSIFLSLGLEDSENFVLILEVDDEHQNLDEIETYINEVQLQVEEKMHALGEDVDFQTGYMFIEKDGYSIKDAIQRAYQQAIAVAEKRLQSEYNDMLYSIRRILNHKDILLMAQPIIDVSSRQIQAYEMLTRGPKDTIFESPLQLFSIARQTNMLYELEIIVLEKAIKQVIETGVRHLIFINFTPMTIGNLQFVKDVSRLLRKYSQLNPRQLIFEVTERESIDDIKHIFSNIKSLREKGIRFAVDDTGAGYASLHTISKIMPDIIKIDRSVIQDIDSNSVKESMLQGLLLIAKETGSLVVAEGIETSEEANVLVRNKVDLAQGYYFAKPAAMPKVKG